MRTEEDKRQVMEKKGRLKGEAIWILEDLTWRERQVRWKIREAVWEEERKGARVWIGNNKVVIEGEWWFWDEETEVLRDRMGRERVRREVGEKGEGV